MNTDNKIPAQDSGADFVPAPDMTLADALTAAGDKEDAAAASAASATSAEEKRAESVASGGDAAYAITQKAIEMLRTVYDPEIPVNVYDLGLIYKIDYTPADGILHVDMTLTAPGCPAADFILEDVRQKLLSVDGPKGVDLQLVFDPVWTQDMMSEEAKLELGFL